MKKALLFGLPVVLLLAAAFGVKTFAFSAGGPDESALAKEPGRSMRSPSRSS